MDVLIISRHQAAIEWLGSAYGEEGVAYEARSHLASPEEAIGFKAVVGNLPIHIIHELNRLGIDFLTLMLDVPPTLRGKDLSSEEFLSCRPRIVSFVVFAGTMHQYKSMVNTLIEAKSRIDAPEKWLEIPLPAK